MVSCLENVQDLERLSHGGLVITQSINPSSSRVPLSAQELKLEGL